MKSHPRILFKPTPIKRQRGVVLFFALISLLAIMLAAVALVRSVDTNTIIAGNLAFQQAATRSADAGTEAAITWLAAIETANASKNVLIDSNHPFNQNAATNGYYASTDPAKSLTPPMIAPYTSVFNWDNTDSMALAAADSSGNSTRYIIQRECRTAGVGAKDANCLFSSATVDNNNQNIRLPQDICNGPGCPAAGQTPQIRITSRTTGPRNTLSYVQTFVY